MKPKAEIIWRNPDDELDVLIATRSRHRLSEAGCQLIIGDLSWFKNYDRPSIEVIKEVSYFRSYRQYIRVTYNRGYKADELLQIYLWQLSEALAHPEKVVQISCYNWGLYLILEEDPEALVPVDDDNDQAEIDDSGM